MGKSAQRPARYRIPDSELSFRFSRSSGPGGQSVNTTDSKVELLWLYTTSRVLDAAQRERITDRLAGRIAGGYVSVTSQKYKSQHRNREAAKVRLEELVADALMVRPRRRPTRRTGAANERRLAAKRRRADIKRSRSGAWD